MADAQANINVNLDTSDALAQLKILQRQISSFHQSMAIGGAKARAESSQLGQTLINNVNASGKFSASIQRTLSTTESFTNSLERNKLSMGQYFKFGMGATRSFGKTFASEFATIGKVARERVKTLQTQYVQLGRDANGAMQSIAVRPLSLDMKNLGTQVMMTAQRQQIFNQLLRQGSTNLLNFGKNTQWAGRQLMVGFTIPLTIMGSVASQEFMKLEEQAVKFRRVYGDMFTTSAETEKALDNVRQLADEFTKYGIAVEKTIDLAAKVAQMGNMGDALEAQVTQATRLAVLGGLEQQEALDTTISLTNAFGVSAEELAGKIAFLNAAENQTVLAIEDFNEAIPKAGSVVQQLGGDVEDLAFFLTAMREGGINASQGANAIKSSLGRLINPTAAAREELSGFGIDVLGIVESNAGNLREMVMQLSGELEKLDPLNRARAIEKLFGKFQFARMSTMFQNISKEGSQARKVLDLTGQSTEELAILAERELGRVENSVGFKFRKQIENLQAALAPIGGEFIKAVTPLLEGATKILKSFNGMGDGAKQFAVIAVAAIGIIAPTFLMLFGLMANGLANFIKGISKIGSFLSFLSGQSKMVGSSTSYMTQEQIEAQAVAASLEQTHQRLFQTFTTERAAVDQLAAAYQRAATQMSNLNTAGAGRATAGAAGAAAATGSSSASRYNPFVPPKKYNKGVVMVPGPKGRGDIVPAMLTPGEAVIPAEETRKYLPLIKGIIGDSLPGYEKSNIPIPPGQTKGYTNAVALFGSNINKGTASRSQATSQLNTGGQALYAPILSEIAESLGATSVAEIRSMISANPEFSQFAQQLSSGVAQGVAEGVGNISDDEIYSLVESQKPTIAGGYSPEFVAASEKVFTDVTTVEDTASKRMNKSRTKLRTGGRQPLVEGESSYRSKMKTYQQVAADLPGAVPQDAVLAHTTPYQVGSPEKLAKERTMTQRSLQLQQNLSSGVEQIRDEATGQTLSMPAGTKLPEARAAFSPSQDAVEDGQDYANALDKTLESSAQDPYVSARDRMSPHEMVGRDAQSDATEYGTEFANTLNQQSSNLTPPAPPSASGKNQSGSRFSRFKDKAKSIGNQAIDRFMDTAPGQSVGNYFAETSGANITNTKGEVIASPTGQAPTQTASRQYLPGQSPSEIQARNQSLVDNRLATFDSETGTMFATTTGKIQGLKDSFSVLDTEITELGNTSQDSASDVDSHTQSVRENGDTAQRSAQQQGDMVQDPRNPNQVVSKKEADKIIRSEDRRQKRQARASKAMMGFGAVTGGLAAATQLNVTIPGIGNIADFAQKLLPVTGALTAIAPILLALPAPLAILVALIGGGVALWMMHQKALKEATKEAYDLAKAMGAGKDSVQTFAEFAGTVADIEFAERQRGQRQNILQLQPGTKTFGSAFFEDDAGQEFAENVRKSLQEVGEDQTIQQVYRNLGNAVLQGALSPEQARSIAASLGKEVEDFGVGMAINANLIELLGPNGENLLEDPLSLQVKILQEGIEDGAEALERSFQSVSDILPETILGGAISSYDPEAMELIDAERDRQMADADGWWEKFLIGIKTTGQIANELRARGIGSALGVLSNNLELASSSIDSQRVATNKQIEDAIAAGEGQKKLDELREDEAAAIQQITDQLTLANQGLFEWWNSLPEVDRERARREQEDRILASAEDQGLDTETIRSDLVRLRSEDEEEQELNLVLRTAIESGDINERHLAQIVENFNDPDSKEIVVDLITRVGGGETSNLLTFLNAVDDEQLKTDILVGFEDLDTEDTLEKISDLDALYRTSPIFEGVDIPINFFTSGEGDLEETMNTAEELKVVAAEGDLFQEDGNIDMGAYADVVGKDVAERAKVASDAIGEEFDALDEAEKLEFFTNFAINAQFTGDPDAIAFLKNQSEELGLNLNFGTPGSEQEQQSTDITLGRQTFNLLPQTRDLTKPPNEDSKDTEPKDGGGGGPEASFLDDIVKQSRDFGNASQELTTGFEASLEAIMNMSDAAFGSNGIANQLRNLNIPETLIDKFLGMPPEEWEKAKDELFVVDETSGEVQGTTAKGDKVVQAQSQATVAEEISNAESQIATTEDQVDAFDKLVASGSDVELAYEMIQNEALATAIATSENTEQTKRLIKTQEELKELEEELEEINEEEQRKQRISDAIEEMNKKFNDQVKALNKIRNATDKYTDAQISSIMENDDLMALFLEPNINPGALDQALDNAEKQAKLELDIKLLTFEGREGFLGEAFSKAKERLTAEQTRIDLEFEAQVSGQEDVIKAAEEEIDSLNYVIDDYQAGITEIQNQEEVINEAYEKRFEALDKIADINDRITAQQKNQLSLADALSKGDIAAAAQAAQAMREQETQDSIDSQREMLEQRQEAEIAALRSTSGFTKKELEDQAKILEDRIFQIEEQRLEPAQESIRLAELRKDREIESLSVLGKTNDEWDRMQNAIDVARTRNYEFMNEMQDQFNMYPEILSKYLEGEPLPAPPQLPPPPAPTRTSGGNDYKWEGRMSGPAGRAERAKARAQVSWRKSVRAGQNPGPYPYSSGGYIARMAMGGAVKGGMFRRMSVGGMVPSYMAMGGKTLGSDLIPAMLTPGEFVIRRPAVSDIGKEKLESMNRGTYKDGSVYNYSLAVNVKSESNPEQIANTVMREIKRIDSQRIRNNRY